MRVHVQTVMEIARPRGEVAAYASDPDNATTWYENIKAVEWKSAKPAAVGSEIAFVAEFMGRRLVYTYRVTEIVPDERFVMATAEGPFPIETTYTWADTANGGTRMTLGNRGDPSGLARVVAPLMAIAIRRANRKDLARLKTIIRGSATECGQPSHGGGPAALVAAGRLDRTGSRPTVDL